jgi:hypothetical protein
MAGVYASADKLFNGDQMSISATASYFNLSPFYKIAKTNFDFYDVPKGESGSLNYIWKTKKDGLLKVKGNYSRSASGIRLPNPFEAGTDMNFAVKNENAFGQASFMQRFGTRFKWFTAASYSYNNDETKWGDFPANTLEKRAQGRTELNWYAHTKLAVLAGVEASAIELEKTFDTLSGNYKEQLVAGYLEAEWHPVYWLAVKPGLRLEHSGFLHTTTLAPRLSASVRTGDFSQASIAGGMFYQNPDKQYLWENYKLEQQLAIHYIANWMYSKSDRTPAYNNLALQASYLTSVGKWFMVLYAGVDNVLNQKNVFGYRYSADGQSRYPVVPALYRSVFVGVNFSLTKFDKDEL